MADLYGASPSSDVALHHDSEDLSPLITQHLHNSSSVSSPSCVSLKNRYASLLHSQSPWQPSSFFSRSPEPTSVAGVSCMVDFTEDRLQPSRLVNHDLSDCSVRDAKFSAGSYLAVNSTFKASDPGDLLNVLVKESAEYAISSSGAFDSDTNATLKRRGLVSENDPGDCSCDSEGGDVPEIPSNINLPGSSSKRSRSAEVHNMSEKRRRRKINEKMKALQNLIPNSNKTDKASMLDEAIEYLKQLQLQVQMLAMRNGLSLQPMCLPGILQPVQLPQMALDFNVGNAFTSRIGLDNSSGNEACPIRQTYDLPNKCGLSDQSIAIPSVPNNAPSEATFCFEQEGFQAYGHFNLSTNFKDATPEVQLDCPRTGKESADVS